MQALITSYLVQKKECNLPQLGHFRIKTKPADFEKPNKQIFPPTDEILYSEFAATISAGLITYISCLQNITQEEAEERINSWCSSAKEKLSSGEKIIFNSIGSLQKDGAGNIFFQRKKNSSLYEPVSIDGIFHSNAEHPVLVGDRETTSGVMNEFYREDAIVKKRVWWKIWAVVLFAISLVSLFVHFYIHGFSETAIGSQASFPTAEPHTLHNSP